MNLADAMFRAVIDISWRSSCLVLVVLALRPLLLGRLPARVFFWVWIAVAIRLLCLFAVPAAWSPFNFTPFDQWSDTTIVAAGQTGVTKARGAESISRVAPSAGASNPAELSLHQKLTLGQWAALVWGLGVAALVLVRLGAYGSFVRTLRRSRAEPSPAIAALVAEAADALGRRPVRVSITDAVHSPALYGIFRPTLLFPPGFLDQLTPRELQFTVAHELAHDQRRDLLVQLLIQAAAILHWFNPLMWAMARVARHDCELACDEFVLRRFDATEREFYGATLLKIVRLASCGTPPPLALSVVESKQQIKRRIQMIIAHQSSTLTATLLGCAFFSVCIGLSLTREVHAQPTPAATGAEVPAKIRTVSLPETPQSKAADDSLAQRLNALFPNGVVASVGDKVITVDDVRREMKPLLPQLLRDARDQDEFNVKLNQLQNSVIKQLVERILLIKEFHGHKDGEVAKHIPAEYIDNRIADTLKEQFDNDQVKFLAYLQTRGWTMSDYRRQVEEDIIYHYMAGQERKLADTQKTMRAKSDSTEGKVHLRQIQLNRSAGATDAALLERANAILARFKNGEAFEALAREFSEDQRRDKGGDWGWQGPTDLKQEFSEKLFAMKKGEVSAPIVIKEGCFLLYVDDRK